jgi:hypothetical protein
VSFRLLDGDGERVIASDEYAELRASARSFDLFIDASRVVAGRSYYGMKRNCDDSIEEHALSRVEAELLVAVLRAGGAVEPGRLRAIGGAYWRKHLESARRKVDIPLSRFKWRSIHTVPSRSGDAEPRYYFHPPPTLRFVVLFPATAGAEEGANL